MKLTSQEMAEFRALVEAICTEQISSAESDRFQELARGSADARRYYLRAMRLHGRLKWHFRGTLPAQFNQGADAQPSPRASAGTAHVVLSSLRTASARLGSWGTSPRLLLAAVLCGLTAYFVAMYISLGLQPAWRQAPSGIAATGTSAGVAVLSAASRCQWENLDRPLVVGQPIEQGILNLKSGVAQITFAGGAVVSLEGPARLNLQSAARGYLHQGRLVADVPQHAIGFTIQTPTATVVDLGTQFGVDTQSTGDSHVHVFKGTVAVRASAASSTNTSSPVLTLNAGQATEINTQGVAQAPSPPEVLRQSSRFAAIKRRVAPASDGLAHRWSFNDGSARDSVGTAHGRLFGRPTIANGRLELDGQDDYVATESLGGELGARTLVVWLQLQNLTQRSGGALSLIKAGADRDAPTEVFDAIVYGERTAKQWMAGSDFYLRTPTDNVGKPEASTDEIMMAIAYETDTILIYRNAALYASYRAKRISFPTTGYVLLGLRHPFVGQDGGTAEGNDGFLAGSINEARIYREVLTADKLKELYRLGPDLLQP